MTTTEHGCEGPLSTCHGRGRPIGVVLGAVLLTACGDAGDDDGSTSGSGAQGSGTGDSGASDEGSGSGSSAGSGSGTMGSGSDGCAPCASDDPPAACGDELDLEAECSEQAFSGCCDTEAKYWFCECSGVECVWQDRCPPPEVCVCEGQNAPGQCPADFASTPCNALGDECCDFGDMWFCDCPDGGSGSCMWSHVGCGWG